MSKKQSSKAPRKVETSRPADSSRPEAAPGPTMPWWQILAAAAVIVIAGIVAYSNSFAGPYIFDDTPSIPKNPFILNLWPITEAMKAPEFQTAAGRPMLSLSLAINYQISEFDVWSYHAVNLLIHIGAALVLFGIVRRTLLTAGLKGRFAKASAPLALICALLWVVHPLNTGSVTYIIQRAESLMGLFYLLTLYVAIRGFASPDHKYYWYAASVAACAIGMGTKEVMFTAPMMVLIYDMVFVGRSFLAPFRRRWGYYLALAMTWGVLFALVAQGPRTQSVSFDFANLTAGDYAVTQCNVLIHYFTLAVWPDKLSLDYDWPVARSFSQYAANGILLLIVMAGVVAALVWRRRWGFLGLWVFLILGPTSSFLPIATEVAAEHRMYLPLIGFVAAAVMGAYMLGQYLVGRSSSLKIPAIAAGCIVTVALSVLLGRMTYKRNVDYRSRESIWRDAVGKLPENSRARHNLGVVLADLGRDEEAIEQFNYAIEIKPAFLAAINDRGISYKKIGQLEEARSDFEKVLSMDPNNAKAHIGLGAASEGLGQYEQAIDRFTKAIASDPNSAIAYSNRGSSYDHSGRYDQAIADLTKAIELDPSYVQAYLNRGAAYAHKGDYQTAIPDYDKAIKLSPDSAEAYYNRGIAYSNTGRPDLALADFNRSIELKGDWPDVYRARAELLRRRGDWAGSLRDCDKAIELLPDSAKGYLVRGNTYLAKGDPQRGVQDLLKAAELDPDDAAVYNKLGLAYRNQGRHIEAEASFGKSASLDPTVATVWNNLGISRGQRGESDLAIQAFTKAIELDPSYAFAYNNRGMAWGNKAEYNKAVADFTRALQANPKFVTAAHHRGSAKLNLRDYDGAMADVKKAIELNPKYTPAYLSAARIRKAQGSSADAAAYYRQALNLEPKNVRVLYELAWLLATDPSGKVRNGADAVRLAKSACEITSFKYYWMVDALAAAYAETGQFDQAIEMGPKAIALAEQAKASAAADALRARIALYKSGNPYRQPD